MSNFHKVRPNRRAYIKCSIELYHISKNKIKSYRPKIFYGGVKVLIPDNLDDDKILKNCSENMQTTSIENFSMIIPEKERSNGSNFVFNVIGRVKLVSYQFLRGVIPKPY